MIDCWVSLVTASWRRERKFWAEVPARLGLNWPRRDWLPEGSVWTDES